MKINYKKNAADANWPKYAYLEKHIPKTYDAEFGNLLTGTESVLEIGCGGGSLLQWLGDKVKKREGIEIDKGMTEEARRANKGVTITKGDFLKINFPVKKSGTYDLIFMLDVIEHIEVNKIIPLLEKCRKLLKKNGKLVLRTPNAQSLYFGSYFRYIDFTHTTAFTRYSITTALLEAGFKNESIKVRKTKTASGAVYTPLRISRWFLETLATLVHTAYFGPTGLSSIHSQNLVAIAQK